MEGASEASKAILDIFVAAPRRVCVQDAVRIGPPQARLTHCLINRCQLTYLARLVPGEGRFRAGNSGLTKGVECATVLQNVQSALAALQLVELLLKLSTFEELKFDTLLPMATVEGKRGWFGTQPLYDRGDSLSCS